MSRLLRGIISLFVGPLLCLTAATSILVMGWQMSLIHARVMRIAGFERSQVTWVLGPRGQGIVSRMLGGLARNIRMGVSAAIALAIATFPFAVFWMVAWWAGWENSFNKGYEQAFVGPLLGFSGISLFALIMIYLPMALAHQAVEDRAFALFEFGRIRSAVACAGWRYTLWALVALILALPIFAGRGLPVFAEEFIPGFADMTGSEIQEMQLGIALATGAYVFLATTYLRSWSAGIYARSAMRALRGRDASVWVESVIETAPNGTTGRRPWQVTRGLHLVLLFVIWSALALLIFVGQFLNHDWHIWLTHPFVFLPWGG